MRPARLVAAFVIAAFLAGLAPQTPVLADGAASTRNILIGGAAATLLIINHNKHVHERYAEDAAAQASLAAQRDDARNAYLSEKKAYQSEAALVADLKREVAYQHQIIEHQRAQLAALAPPGASGEPSAEFAAQTTMVKPTPAGGSTQVAVTSYGWGTI